MPFGDIAQQMMALRPRCHAAMLVVGKSLVDAGFEPASTLCDGDCAQRFKLSQKLWVSVACVPDPTMYEKDYPDMVECALVDAETGDLKYDSELGYEDTCRFGAPGRHVGAPATLQRVKQELTRLRHRAVLDETVG